MIAQINKILRPVHNRLRTMISRAIINIVKDDGALQLLQVTVRAEDTLDGIERFGMYGVASNPIPGAEGIILNIGGVTSHGVVIAVEDRRYRLKGLVSGEVALYDDLGQKVHLTRAGIVVHSDQKVDVAAPEVTVTANHIALDADSVDISGDVSIGGALDVDGDTHLSGNLALDGNGVLGSGATKYVKLADGSVSTKVKAE